MATFLGGGTVLARVINRQARFGPLALPLPQGTVHEEGASVELLFRPEQVALTADEPAGPARSGKGAVTEQTFSGATRRLRLRLPRLATTRQISPTTSFGEEGMLVDAIVPAEFSVTGEFWVSLREWSVLEQARPEHPGPGFWLRPLDNP